MDGQLFAFGDFQFAPAQRRLLRKGETVRLGSRAMDLLAVLVERAGEIVSKDDLIAAVWPTTFVDEANLRVHVSGLRRALGEEQLDAPLIQNVPGRGYCFVAPIAQLGRVAKVPPPDGASRLSNLPLAAVRPVGRAEFIDSIVNQLPVRRLLTVIGPGGMGKTTVAIAAAQRLVDLYPDGVVFVDFGAVTDPEQVVPALLSAIEQVHDEAATVRDPGRFLRNRRMLLVLDNCEHLIDAVATLVTQLLQTCPELRLIATSREPLRVHAEWVQRLPSLGFPNEEEQPDKVKLLSYPAVQLFLDRVSETLGGFEVRESDIAVVAEICRRLDGIALALELAAGRIDSLGLAGLAAALDDRFRLLRQGRRTALPRHQTLRATLDWSFTLLSADEQRVLRRLSVFNGGFSADAARQVGMAETVDDLDADDAIASLTSKSLLSVEMGLLGTRYRLLETTRTYCWEKLIEAGEAAGTAKRHAHYYAELLPAVSTHLDWLDRYSRDIGNVRAALDWAFSPGGSETLGIALTVAAIPLWFHLALVDERLVAAQRAVARLDRLPDGDRRQRMQLNVVLGWPQMNAISGVESGPEAWRTVLDIATELDETDYQLRALWALWVDRTNSGDHHTALALAEQFVGSCQTSSEPGDALIGQRMVGRSQHLLGNQADAQTHIRQMLASYGESLERSHAVRFQYDQRITAQATLARILFVQGHTDEAVAEIRLMVEVALRKQDTPTLCHVLSDAACLVTLLAGELDLARDYAELLFQRSAQGTMDVWHTYARACAAIISMHDGMVREGVSELRLAIDTLERSGYLVHFAPLRAYLAEGLSAIDRQPEATRLLDKEIERCRQSGDHWYLPELLRLRASLGVRDLAGLRDAQELAREQGAQAWARLAASALAGQPLQRFTRPSPPALP